MDVELHTASKEAEERVASLSEEFEQRSFLREGGLRLSTLVQTIRGLTGERKCEDNCVGSIEELDVFPFYFQKRV